MGDDLGTLDGLLVALGSPDPQRRHAATIRLCDFTDDVVELLFRESGRPENRHYTGSLVYSLRRFKCSKHFDELFAMALHGDFEVQCHALAILQAQVFDVTADQLRDAERALGLLEEHKGLSAESLGLLRGELQEVLAGLHPETGE